MSGSKLGKWTLLDIETTGIDAGLDEIIDIGFLEFEGTRLVKKYSSLVRPSFPVSKFIQKLTGITDEMAASAPLWDVVEPELLSLEGYNIIAHNSDFEESFLARYFQEANVEEQEKYHDSLLYLGLLHPGRSSLKLENFIIEFGLADKELHRGLSDSVDLLKVMLVSTYLTHRDKEKRFVLEGVFNKYFTEEFWFKKFFMLSEEELFTIANSIDFAMEETVEKYLRDLDSIIENEESDYIKEFETKLSKDNLTKIFSSEDIVKEKIPRYKFREPQLGFASRVAQSFKNKINALIQAPTGTGKTLGYLIPSALFASENNEQILISTGTNALQTQLIQKDVPLLRKILNLDEKTLRVTRLVGSSNHICELLHRKDENDGELLSNLMNFEERFSKAYFDHLFFVNSRLGYDEKITRLDLPYILKMKLPNFKDYDDSIKVDFRACIGGKCSFKGSCSYICGLSKAKESEIIVGNHSLTFSWPKNTPRPGYIVIDEAHKIEKEATSAFTIDVAQKTIESFTANLNGSKGLGSLFYLLNEKRPEESAKLIEQIRKEARDVQDLIHAHMDDLPFLIESLLKKLPRYTTEYWNETYMISKNALNDELRASVYNKLDSLSYIFTQFFGYLMPYLNYWDANELSSEGQMFAFTQFESFMALLEDIEAGFRSLLLEEGDNSRVIRYKESDGFVLRSSPINVGEQVFEQLVKDSESTVFTSATLANSDGSIGTLGVEWMSGYAYLAPEKRFKRGLYLPPVYNYKDQARVHLVNDFMSTYDTNFVAKMIDEVIPTIKKLGGKTLFLFSANARFSKAVEYLLEKIDSEIPVFIQDMGPNVIEEFKAAENGILVGKESFSEGIDIPGESLSLIIIDKIPDLRQDLIIKDRQNFYDKTFGNAFDDYFLASRTRMLHQKLGRLIRTESDHGAIIIFDSRVARWRSKTLNTFKSLMEPYDINISKLDDALKDTGEYLNLN